MRVVNLQCPNCGARLTVENDMYVCNSCGTTMTIDYDDSDVEYAKLQTEAERDQRKLEHDKELLEKEYELRQQETLAAEKRLMQQERRESVSRGLKKFIIFICIFAFVGGCFVVSIMMSKARGERTILDEISDMTATPTPEPTPTPAPNYRITPDIIVDELDGFIEAGRAVQMEIDQCGVKNENGVVRFYDKTDAVFLDAYIVSNIPDAREPQSCRLVLIYEVTWYNEDYGYQTCYDGVYFDGIKVTPDGKIIPNYDGNTIWRSEAAWGWSMEYSFEHYDRCYLENVAALGGHVEEVLLTYANTDPEATDVADLDMDYEEDED